MVDDASESHSAKPTVVLPSAQRAKGYLVVAAYRSSGRSLEDGYVALANEYEHVVKANKAQKVNAHVDNLAAFRWAAGMLKGDASMVETAKEAFRSIGVEEATLLALVRGVHCENDASALRAAAATIASA